MEGSRNDDPKAIGPVDAFQRRHPVVSFPLAVVYKYFDDQGAYLAAILTYYSFIAIFPSMLMATSILGFVLQGDPSLQKDVLNSALSQFPVVGDQIGRPGGLRGSTSAIIVGAVAALYGATGLGQAAQNAANVAWAIPRNSRANPFLSRARSLVFLAISGLGVLAISVATTVLAHPAAFNEDLQVIFGWLIRIVGALVTFVIFCLIFWLLGAGSARWRSVLPGAATTALLWQVLQWAGGSYVTRVVARASHMNSVFAVVLGLVAFLFIASVMAVIGLEVNVVAYRRLYPRALLTPFTDNVLLTEADRRAYAGYAMSQRHKGFQSVDVTFDEDAPS